MRRFIFTFIIIYIIWIFLVHTLDYGELLVGAGISVLVTLATYEFFTEERHRMIFNPVNWLRFLAYIIVLLYAETVSHIDVAYRVLTGRIRPAIVKVPTEFRTALGKTLVSNSITLTPGTLTLEAGRDSLYVHTIGYDRKKEIGKIFERFGTGVTE